MEIVFESVLIAIVVSTVGKQKLEEIGQQALLHSEPHAMQVQGRDKVTAEGMVSREQRLETPRRKIPSALMNMSLVREGGGNEC